MCELWSSIAENTLAESAVDCEGHPVRFKRDFFGRGKRPLFVRSDLDQPAPKNARWGDVQFRTATPTVEYRRHIRQAHRLQSLVRQLDSFYKKPSKRAEEQLVVLWNAIIQAKGFHKSFSHWAFQHGANFLPLKLPDLEFARCLTDAFVEWHAANTSYFARENRRIRYVNRLLDIQQGGKQTFRAIADEPPPPLQFVHFPKEFTVVRQKWPKTGKHQIILEDVSNLRLDAIRFQGQEVCIKK